MRFGAILLDGILDPSQIVPLIVSIVLKSMSNFAAKRAVLLTGAGFTNTVGAPLAKTMWSWIFHKEEIQKSPHLRELLLGNFNFEDVYHSVLLGDYTLSPIADMET